MSTVKVKVPPLDVLGRVDTSNLSNLIATVGGTYLNTGSSGARFSVPAVGGGLLTLKIKGLNLPSSDQLLSALQNPTSLPVLLSASEITFVSLGENSPSKFLFSWDADGASVGFASFLLAVGMGNINDALNLFLGGEDTVVSFVNLTIEPLPLVENVTLVQGARNVIGNDAENRLVGNRFVNSFTGGGGSDIFAVGARPAWLKAGVVDIITDFESGADKIELSRSSFSGNAVQPSVRLYSSTQQFNSDNGGRSRPELFIYNQETGYLYLNRNGDRPAYGAGGAFVRLYDDAMGPASLIQPGDFILA